MGQRYFLSKKDYKNKIGIKNTLILKDVLTPKEAKELIEIQTVIANEISEPITILTEEGLTKKSPYRFKETIFCLAVKD